MTRAAGLSVALFLLLLLPPAGAGADSDSDSEEDRESCRQRCQEGPASKSNKKHGTKCCDKKPHCGCKTTTTAPSTGGAAASPTPVSATCCPGPSLFTTGSHGSLTSGANPAPGSPTSQRAAISASLGTGVLLLLLLALLGALWHRRKTREKESAVRIEPGYVLAQAPQQVAGTGRQARPEHLYEEVGDPGSRGVREQSADAVARIGSEYALAQAPEDPSSGRD